MKAPSHIQSLPKTGVVLRPQVLLCLLAHDRSDILKGDGRSWLVQVYDEPGSAPVEAVGKKGVRTGPSGSNPNALMAMSE